MRYSVQQLITFAHVMREASISKAAARLGLTQSAVSQQISRLEQTIGSKLFIRSSSGLELSPAGQSFQDLADRLAALDQVIAEKIEGFSNLEAGSLRIIATAPRPALNFIALYQQQWPKVKLELTLVDWTTAMRMLRERLTDIAIVTDPGPLENFVSLEVESVLFTALMQKDHPLATRAQISLSDLQCETVLLPEAGSLTRRIVFRTLKKQGLALERTVLTSTYAVMKEAVLHGVGVGICLENSMYPDDRLTSRPIAELASRFQTHVITPRDRFDLRLVKSFFDITVLPAAPEAAP